MKTKRTNGFILGAVLAGALALAGCSESSEEATIDRSSVDGLPSITSTASATGTVKIEAVDYENRSIALEGPDGKSEIFRVPPEVRNFKQIKQGDVVKATYLQKMNVNVRKVGQPLASWQVLSVSTAPLGDKPGIVAVRTVQSLANVKAIDYQARTVTLLGTSGNPVTVHVSKEMTGFDNVVQGDQVIFTYTESITIEVTE